MSRRRYLGGFKSVTPGYFNSEDDHRYVLDDCGAAVLLVDALRAGRAQAIVAGHPEIQVFALTAPRRCCPPGSPCRPTIRQRCSPRTSHRI